MKRSRCWCIHRLCLPFSFCFVLAVSASCGTDGTAADSLDSTIRSYAFRALARRRTGIVYDVPLPGNFSDVRAAAAKIRGRTLWLEGINISSVQVSPGTVSVPPARRVVLVYQNLGNRSDCYYKAQDYRLATPVFGLLAYDGNGLADRKLDFNMKGRPITISFPRVDFPRGSNSTRAKCIAFDANGSRRLDNLKGKSACSAENGGHFAIVVPSEDVLAPPPTEKATKARREWTVWVMALGIAVVGLVFLGLVVIAIAAFAKKRRMEKMARRADEGEVLETVWVTGSKMPSASMVRTQPVLVNESTP